jgi:hypothetical protein
MEYDSSTSPIWLVIPPSSHDFLDSMMPSYEDILEYMIELKIPWEYMHHRSFFLLKLEKLKVSMKILVSSSDSKWYHCPIPTCHVYEKMEFGEYLENYSCQYLHESRCFLLSKKGCCLLYYINKKIQWCYSHQVCRHLTGNQHNLGRICFF